MIISALEKTVGRFPAQPIQPNWNAMNPPWTGNDHCRWNNDRWCQALLQWKREIHADGGLCSPSYIQLVIRPTYQLAPWVVVLLLGDGYNFSVLVNFLFCSISQCAIALHSHFIAISPNFLHPSYQINYPSSFCMHRINKSRIWMLSISRCLYAEKNN